MKNKDFLLKLNSLTITNNYDANYFNSILNMLKIFLHADTVVCTKLRRSEDNQPYHEQEITNKDVVLNLENEGKVIIKNIKVNLEDSKFFFSFLTSILNNIFKNYALIEKIILEKYMDNLLQVFNRTAYEETLTKPEFYDIGVCFVDINGLGIINNKYGHEEGDLLLKTIANFFKKNFRYKDIFRIGGDELVIICENIDKELFINKLTSSLNLINNTPYSVSIGTLYTKTCHDLKNMVKKAEFAMEENKQQFRKEHPELYINKYEVEFIGNKKRKS